MTSRASSSPAVIACLSVSIDASQAGGVIGQRLPIRSTGPTRFIGVPSRTAPRVTGATAARRRASRCNWRGGDQPVGNTPWRSLYRRWRSGTRPSTRVVPNAIGRFICVWKHELIPRTPISTRSRSTNTRRRELAAIRGRVSWRGYVRSGAIASILACRQHVRLAGNLGNAGSPVLPVEGSGLDVIQAPKPEPRIMRDELTDFEWATIRSFLPNEPRGIPRVDDRRVLNGIFWL